MKETATLLLLSILIIPAISTCSHYQFQDSSINCSLYSGLSVFTYSNETVQNHAIELLLSLSNTTTDGNCTELLNRFLCNVIFPPCDQSSEYIQRICSESCEMITSTCASQVEEIYRILRQNDMDDVAIKLQTCGSPLLEPNVNSTNLPNCVDLTASTSNETDFVQCIPPPREHYCHPLLFNNDIISSDSNIEFGYAVDIANRPFVRRAGEAIQMLSTNVSSDDMFCSDILKQIACVSFFPPCNLETKKLTSICADSCPTYYEIISKCTSVFLQYDLDYNFNCLNPGTYYIGVPSRLFDVPENCRSYDTTEEPNSGDDFPVAGKVGIIVALVIVTVLVIGVVFVWKYSQNKKRTIVLAGQISYNARYGVDTIDCRNSTFPIKNKEGRSQLVATFKEELGDVLIPPENLKIISIIGEGSFGMVCKSQYHNPMTGSEIEVAVKGLKDTAGELNDLKLFLNECCRMKILDHPNVVPLIGVSIDSDSIPAMVLPFMANGDVKDYLLSKRVSEDDVDTFPPGITYSTLLGMCHDVAKGMNYLSQIHFVHRDLAARNCMVDADLTVKVSDFGLSRDIYENDYYLLTHDAKVPVKWMAPESIYDKIYTHQSDVVPNNAVLLEHFIKSTANF
ncbi:uncharacterized protein [Dysidea avara]|uniref:uncharacterized protein isoform X2 n=1 Tax=Dysidea avara TaxID=196820 RepID=UPI00331FF94A